MMADKEMNDDYCMDMELCNQNDKDLLPIISTLECADFIRVSDGIYDDSGVYGVGDADRRGSVPNLSNESPASVIAQTRTGLVLAL